MTTRKNPRAIDLPCPRCSARPGKPCKGSRIPSASTMGGGWGGPVTRQRPHAERYEARKLAIATAAEDFARGFDAGNYDFVYASPRLALCNVRKRSSAGRAGYVLGFFSSLSSREIPTLWLPEYRKRRKAYPNA